MTKLGMPTINIAFVEKGIEAVERSSRGILAIILEDTAEAIGKLAENPFTIYTTDDIPENLSDDNKDYLTKALIGYVKAPYRVKVWVQTTAEASADRWTATLKKLTTERWDYLVIPAIDSTELETVGTWLKTNRDNKNKRSKVILPNYSGDYEGIINFSNTSIVTSSKTYTGAQYTPRIGGLICGTPMTISCTYAPLAEVVDVDRHDADENDEKVNKGELFIWYDGEKCKLSRGVNSLVTTTQGKLEAYQTIKSVDIMDMIYDDIHDTIEDYYIGKYTNDYDNKQLLISAVLGYLRTLEDERLLQKNESTVEINLEAVKNWRLSNGKNTKDELAAMSDLEIAKLDTKKHVFLKISAVILDAMEDFDLNFSI
nr:MAG TPA: tail sheath protein [Caudoviricetes sp.]